MRRVWLGASAVVVLAATSPGPVLVEHAWARASLPGQDMAAAYLTLTSPADDELTRVDADHAAASIHRTVRTDGMSRMGDIALLPLPAGQPVPLAPGGTHIMLMLPPGQSLPEGSTVRLTLHFRHAPDEQVTVPVRPARATGP